MVSNPCEVCAGRSGVVRSISEAHTVVFTFVLLKLSYLFASIVSLTALHVETMENVGQDPAWILKTIGLPDATATTGIVEIDAKMTIS